MEKDLELVELFDIYKKLLTEKQRDIFADYFLFDLSLAEIASEKNISRQSVHDAIKKTEEKLYELESALKLNEKNKKLTFLASNINDKEISNQIIKILGE